MIIDIVYLIENVMNQDLYESCIKDDNERIKRLINIVEKKIKLYIDIDQFKNENGKYIFPEDLQEVARFLVESLYLMQETETSAIKGKIKSFSEKHDDYSKKEEYSATGDYQSKLFYDIPILKEYLDILDKYRGENIIQCAMNGRIGI